MQGLAWKQTACGSACEAMTDLLSDLAFWTSLYRRECPHQGVGSVTHATAAATTAAAQLKDAEETQAR